MQRDAAMRSLVLRLRQGCDIGAVISWLRLITEKLKIEALNKKN